MNSRPEGDEVRPVAAGKSFFGVSATEFSAAAALLAKEVLVRIPPAWYTSSVAASGWVNAWLP